MLPISVFPFMRISAGSLEIGLVTFKGSAKIVVSNVSHPRSVIGLKPVFKLELQTDDETGSLSKKRR